MERVERYQWVDPSRTGLSHASEAELVEEARALREDAWAEIYRRHAQQVYGYIYFRLGDQHTSEDLTADVFVKALAGIKSYEYRGTPLLAWLYRIAHNATADYRKQAARRKNHSAEATEDIRERHDRLQALDDRRDIVRAISKLTEEQQQVVILRFYQQMSNAHVATVLGKTEGAVKALQARALRSMRRVLSDANGVAR